MIASVRGEIIAVEEDGRRLIVSRFLTGLRPQEESPTNSNPQEE